MSRHHRHNIDSLELRRLLSSAVNAGVLTLTGGDNADTFTIALSGSTNLSVKENSSASQLYPLSSITSISVSLGGGNDTLTINNGVLINAVVHGEAGDDTIKTGGGNDTLDGGLGDDLLNGGAGGEDVIDYSDRSTPITARNSARWESVSPYGPVYVLTGYGGAAGESDSYIDAEIISGGSGNDSLQLDGVGNGSYYIDETTPPMPPLRANGLGGDDALSVGNHFDGFGFEAFPLEIADGGKGNDSFTIGGLPNAITVIGGEGNDDFYSPYDDSGATVDPGPGFDSYETSFRDMGTYHIPLGLEVLIAANPNGLIGNDEDNIVYTYGANGVIDLGGGNDFVNSSSLVTVVGGEGNDTLVGVADEFQGGNGTDEYRYDFSAETAGGTYTISSTSTLPTMTDVEAVHLVTSEFADTINVANWDAPYQLILDSRGGVDTFNINNTAPNADVNIVSGDGEDVVNINADYTGTANVHLYQAETFARLTIGEGGTLVIEPSENETNTLRITELQMPFGPDSTAVIDLANNVLIVDYPPGPSQPRSYYETLAGWGSLTGWTHSGLRSSTAAASPGYALGIADASDAYSSFPAATFGGQSVDSTSVIVRYTRAGDLNLDRLVDFNDLVTLSQNYGQNGKSYRQGNLSYDPVGGVNFTDLVILAQNYGARALTIAAPPTSKTKTPARKSAAVDVLS